MECLIAIAFMVASVSSTSTPCSNCDSNIVTCVDGVCLPRCVSVTSSGQCLQCLDSRFYGEQCQHDCPDTCLNSRCQMNNTRVVCTEGCVAGKKGDNCGVACPTACTQCERYGDGCTGPCQNPRYYGPHCRTPCSSNCTDGCNRITGECGSCEPDYTGDKCNVTCSPNCRDGCDKDTGECGSCVSGYRGKNCNDTCPSNCSDGCDKEIGKCESCNPGNSGKYCNISCPITCRKGCDQDGGCNETEGCVAGKKGDNCGADCPTACTQCERYGDGCTGPCQNPRFYGPHCRTPCSSSCTDGCNRITGECVSCEPGYMGDKCDVTCPPNCRDGCDKDTGECDSCEQGYTGDKCNVTCPPNCRDGCDKDTGECDSCVPGYTGTYCNVTCPPNCGDGCDKDTGECIKLGNNVVIAVVIIAGILGLVVLSVTIPLVCNQVQKRSTARVVAPDIEQDISEHSYDNIDNTFFDMEDKVADAVPVDDPNNKRSLRSSHPIGASAEEPQRANHKEFITAPVMKGGAERLSNETIVVFLPKPSVHVHYINTTPRPEDILHDYN